MGRKFLTIVSDYFGKSMNRNYLIKVIRMNPYCRGLLNQVYVRQNLQLGWANAMVAFSVYSRYC